MTEHPIKSGYLNQDFRIFYNKDRQKKTFPLHYHDFHKLMLFLAGNVSYIIEGKQYGLQPMDIVLVPAGQLHRPVIHDDSVYERLILYLSDAWFAACREASSSEENADLFQCFATGKTNHTHLIRPEGPQLVLLRELQQPLIRCASDHGFAAALLQRSRAAELLILLNRMVLEQETSFPSEAASNPVILGVMDYINAHLAEESLCIDTIAKHALLGRSYLMHLFKAETGYTLGRYMTEKRLFLARSYLEQGLSVTDACYRSGFGNYSSFYYAYKKKYGSSPLQKRTEQLQPVGE